MVITPCPPLQAAILRLKPHGSGFAELHRHFMQLEGRLQALPFYHPMHLKGWPHADGCVLTPFYACMHSPTCSCRYSAACPALRCADGNRRWRRPGHISSLR